jgi:hypothetical protein
MDTNKSLPDTIVQYIITNIDRLASYARTLCQYHHITQDQQKYFLKSADDLDNLKNKWIEGIGKCLSKSDLTILYDFGNLLTKNSINHYFISNRIYDRLAKFWFCIQDIPDDKSAEVILGQQATGLSLPSSFDKIHAAKENTNLMIEAVIERTHKGTNNNLLVLDFPAILLTIIIRSEAHEYTLQKILQRAASITKNRLDIPDLLSVTDKQAKREEFKPDTRAIRDATAHAKFRIENNSTDDFIISFNNTDEGYSYQKTFSRKDLLGFYQDYDRMITIHTRLLTIKLLYSLLNMHFVYF